MARQEEAWTTSHPMVPKAPQLSPKSLQIKPFQE